MRDKVKGRMKKATKVAAGDEPPVKKKKIAKRSKKASEDAIAHSQEQQPQQSGQVDEDEKKTMEAGDGDSATKAPLVPPVSEGNTEQSATPTPRPQHRSGYTLKKALELDIAALLLRILKQSMPKLKEIKYIRNIPYIPLSFGPGAKIEEGTEYKIYGHTIAVRQSKEGGPKDKKPTYKAKEFPYVALGGIKGMLSNAMRSLLGREDFVVANAYGTNKIILYCSEEFDQTFLSRLVLGVPVDLVDWVAPVDPKGS
eukprot:NODE_3376_length_989_cov_31.719149_g3103_i0.p1 GENE.NODE_3376_length_989_cov_31.719149_g3103_i0~~NODE_3376_length_989_cov_31.719149_g3103_i0.p1  ORF type:complete len:277 (-),score=69.18 NODE_3376_length_989_cov_31.719149_g3103_i0:158-922(-)